MYFFPTITIDNFFKDPQEIRKFALAQEYFPAPQHNFSGKRTANLWETYPFLAEKISAKVLMSCGFQVERYICHAFFHLTGENFGDTGWAHEDFSSSDNPLSVKFASIIYLNPDVSGLSGGTSIYKLKNFNYNVNGSVDVMRDSFKNNLDNKEARKNHNSNYEEEIRIGGAYNRLVCYDSRRPHSGFGYFGNSKEEQRLTCILFFNNITFKRGCTPFVAADMDVGI